MKPDQSIARALLQAFSVFGTYLSAEKITLADKLSNNETFAWLVNLVDDLQ